MTPSPKQACGREASQAGWFVGAQSASSIQKDQTANLMRLAPQQTARSRRNSTETAACTLGRQTHQYTQYRASLLNFNVEQEIFDVEVKKHALLAPLKLSGSIPALRVQVSNDTFTTAHRDSIHTLCHVSCTHDPQQHAVAGGSNVVVVHIQLTAVGTCTPPPQLPFSPAVAPPHVHGVWRYPVAGLTTDPTAACFHETPPAA